MKETGKLVPTSFQLQIMAQSRNNVKALPGWSARGTRHIYQVNRKDHYHLIFTYCLFVEKHHQFKGCGTGGGGKLYKVKLL